MNFYFSHIAFCFLVFVSLFFIPKNSKAQLIERPLKKEFPFSNARLKNTRKFPFFDDFSDSRRQVDESKWKSSENISISPSAGINAPSYNVAVLNSTKIDGNTYSEDSQKTGKIDSLSSIEINLVDIPSSKREKIYLSFFVQKAGITDDFPESPDSLNISFLNKNDTWDLVWSSAEKTIKSTSFQEYFVKLEPEYFHENFQFKFQSYGNQSGNYDVWLLDYIQLAHERNGINTPKLDRAINSTPSSLFDNYRHIPKTHIKKAKLSDSISFSLFNLENSLYPVHYSVYIKEKNTGIVLDTLGEKFQNFINLRPKATTNIKIANTFDINKIRTSIESIETLITCYTGDGKLIENIVNEDTTRYDKVNLEINDSIRNQYHLNNFYAYDDGTAEASAGINQNGGEIACKFVFLESDQIDTVQIYFPNTGYSEGSQLFRLKVYESENGLPKKHPIDSMLHNTVQTGDSSVFTEYALSRPIYVKDTIYISIESSSDKYLGIGLDKENVPSDDILFQKISTQWEKAKNIGRLMIRPVLHTQKPLPDGVLDNEKKQLFSLHPNPNTGTLRINSQIENIKIYNTFGQEVKFSTHTDSNYHTIKITNSNSGIHILKGEANNRIYYNKFLLNNGL